MQLTDTDRKKITEWLSEKCGQMRCFCCGNGQWTLAPQSTVLIGFDIHTTRFHYSQGVPIVSVVCSSCGHIVSFSTAMMGFKPDEPLPPTADRG